MNKGDYMIDVIINMLEEEKKRNLLLKKTYEKELAMLPKGVYKTKSNTSNVYYERVYYDSKTKKPCAEYIGKETPELKPLLGRRGYIKEELKFIEYDLRLISQMLNIANKQRGNFDIRENLRKLRADKNGGNIVPPQIATTHEKNYNFSH